MISEVMKAKRKAVRERCICPECGASRKVTEEQRQEIISATTTEFAWPMHTVRRILDILDIEDIKW